MVIPVVKGNFSVTFRRRGNPANARVARASGGSALRAPDTGAALPNHPRYQLRYTRIFDFCFLKFSLSVVIPVVKGDFAASFRRREKPENARVVQAFSVSALRIMDSTAALPNHPRCQLRYTRLFDFRFLEFSLSVVIPVVKGVLRRVSGGGKSPQTQALRSQKRPVRQFAELL